LFHQRAQPAVVARAHAAVLGRDELGAGELGLDHLGRSVAGAVIHHAHGAGQRAARLRQVGIDRVQAARQQVAHVPIDDDDAEVGAAAVGGWGLDGGSHV
jgi:hypothetical protein